MRERHSAIVTVIENQERFEVYSGSYKDLQKSLDKELKKRGLGRDKVVITFAIDFYRK